jgi:two-component system, OmpR family, response regulator
VDHNLTVVCGKNIERNMSKVIEANFLAPETAVSFSWSGPMSRWSSSDTRRVLVVDDDRDTTRLIKILLERRGGYAVAEENDPTRANQTARSFRPDVILLDIMMPETDGGEVAAGIDGDPCLKGTPIIFLTALVTRTEAKSGLEIQGHSFLAKPISIPEVIEAIEQHVPKRAKSA